MMLYLNAWLDCTHPEITIKNSTTNETLVHFSALEIDALFESGEITLEELSSNDMTIQQEVIKTLFLSRIMINFKQQLHSIGKNIQHRKSLLPFPEISSFSPLSPAVAVSSSFSLTDILAQSEKYIIRH
ncbi:MAG: hypothetical protein KAG20_10345 [Cocleimonas sp.]|nr:hypothetical protein [Cocleimonas sp.]